MPHLSPHSHRRRTAALSTGVLLALASAALIAPVSPAAAAAMTEGFDATSATAAPAGWSVEHRNIAGMRPDWGGWTFHTTADVVAQFGGGGDRSSFGRAQGIVAVVQSDTNRPTSGTFDSTLWTAAVPLTVGSGAVRVAFDSHYKQGQSPQTATLLAKFDGGAPVQVAAFSSARLNESTGYTVDVPAGAQNVQFGWSYLQSSNNWFWMIDNVSISETTPADVTPAILSARKPVLSAGGTTTVRVGGLRAGQQLAATLGDATTGTPVAGIPAAAADGTVSFDVVLPGDQPAGTVPLHLSGAGIASASIEITVLTSAPQAGTTTEPQVWFDGFEAQPSEWEANGWELTTRATTVEAYGTDRRHAFTRASGTIAVAEASQAPFDGALTSAPVAVTAGDALELRFDSHYRGRGGAQRGHVTAVFDSGERAELRAWGTQSEESAQPRLAFTTPAGATSVRFEFGFAAEAGAGSWMIDDVQVVRPLAPLPADAQARALVDVFSDVQGADARLQNQVLPGFRAMQPQADAIVSNGDLTSNGTTAQYDSYLNAFATGGGAEYGTSISTIGNHEFYGSSGSANYINRFLDRTEMRDVGGQGGLWGEELIDGVLPVLWIGSEFHDYPKQTGSGPFVEMSDEQFWWLSNRLAHYRELNMPVLLFSHHVFANSVSGTYINFTKNEFGADQARLEALIADNPHVTLLTSHTHWSPLLNDWSVEQRFDPAQALAPTFVNTAAVTTMYGPSGDWGETAVGGADPVGLRAALYEDRLRVTAYSFGAGGATSEIRHIDVPLPAEATVDPELPAPAEIVLSTASVTAGEQITIAGSGFIADEELAFELRSTPTPLGDARADATGALSATVTVPADVTAGEHRVYVTRADGTELSYPLTVIAAEMPGGGDSGAGGSGSGSGTQGNGLAATGAEITGIAAIAALLLAAGGLLFLHRAKRARLSEAMGCEATGREAQGEVS